MRARLFEVNPARIFAAFCCNKVPSPAFIRVASNYSKLCEVHVITAKVQLTQSLTAARQFAATTGSEHHLLLDDAAGGTGPKPVELVAVALASCTAFDVITILRQKYQQRVTGYEVRVEADQAERPPQVFTVVRIHHVLTGFEINSAAIEAAIRLSEEKYCSVGAMVKQTARLHTTYEVVEEKTTWLASTTACGERC
jgi:putative redox protein